MGSRAARLSGLDSGGPRLCNNSGPFQRDGRAAYEVAARNARSRFPDFGCNAGGTCCALRRCQPSCGRVIERLSQIASRPVSRETFEKLEAYAALLKEENKRQNLVSVSAIDNLWER